jgi:hypothetical protein
MLLWDHGTTWVNYEFQADIVIAPAFGRAAADGVRGLIVSARDKDNHVRLEMRHKGDKTVAVLVRRKEGTETVLAENKSAPGYQPFDWKTNPMCPGWHKNKDVGPRVKGILLDRLRVQVKQGQLRAWSNGTEIFPGGVKDSDIGVGTIGMYCEGVCVFDNLVVKGK